MSYYDGARTPPYQASPPYEPSTPPPYHFGDTSDEDEEDIANEAMDAVREMQEGDIVARDALEAANEMMEQDEESLDLVNYDAEAAQREIAAQRIKDSIAFSVHLYDPRLGGFKTHTVYFERELLHPWELADLKRLPLVSEFQKRNYPRKSDPERLFSLTMDEQLAESQEKRLRHFAVAMQVGLEGGITQDHFDWLCKFEKRSPLFFNTSMYDWMVTKRRVLTSGDVQPNCVKVVTIE